MNRLIVLLSIGASLLGGCAASGVVMGVSGSRVDAMAPDIRYVTPAGAKMSFHWARCPVALVAFTLPGDSAAFQLDPTMVRLADRLWDLPVTVAQVSLPREGATPGTGREAFDLHKSGMMCLYDPDRIAWQAYGQPAPGELFLIDEHGRIVMTGSLTNPQAVLDEARRLGQIEQDHRELEVGLGL
jgi:hypothetical protein